MKTAQFKNRRQFLGDLWKYSMVAGGFTIIPNTLWASNLLGYSEDPYTLRAFEAMFQSKAQKSLLIDVTHDLLPETQGSFNPGQGKKVWNTEIAKKLKESNFPTASTPIVKYEQKPNDRSETYANKGQLVSIKDDYGHRINTGAFIGLELNQSQRIVGNEVYMVHPYFVKYIKLAEYFCYGKPCSNPKFSTCRYCNELFIQQDFFYGGDSRYDQGVNQLYHNIYCTRSPKNGFGQSLHNALNLQVKPIQPCSCDNRYEKSSYRKINNY